MKDRNLIEDKYKWNLKDIYLSWDEWDKDLKGFKELVKEIPKFKGQAKKKAEAYIEL